MMKKLLFLSSAKLTAMCFGLLLAVFCTIGMSFTPATEDNVADPNDPTSQVRKPRRGPGWCGHDTDYFQGIAISKKQGGTGNVYVQRDEVGDVAEISDWQDEYTTGVLNCAVDEDNNNDYLNFYAKVESGYFGDGMRMRIVPRWMILRKSTRLMCKFPSLNILPTKHNRKS